MVDLIQGQPKKILEPTSGKGNLVNEVKKRYPDCDVSAPADFFKSGIDFYDYIIANPPFTPMKLGYDILEKCLYQSDNLIFLMPWLSIINSQKRTKRYIDFGLKKVIHLPRIAFPGSRVQTCILLFERGFNKTINLSFISHTSFPCSNL